MDTGITEAELLEALAAAIHTAAPDGARTVREISAATGVHEKRVKRWLQQQQDAGRLVVHRVRRQRIDGVPTYVPAYTLLAKP